MGSMMDKVKHMGNDKFISWFPDHVDDVAAAGDDTLNYAMERWDKLMPGIPLEGAKAPEPPEPPDQGYDEDVAAKIAQELTGAPQDDETVQDKQHVPDVLLSETERVLASLINASNEYPEIDVGRELGKRSALAIPEGLARPEYRYKWVDISDVHGQLTLYGGKWMPVNSTNHGHFRRNIWSNTGGVIYRGQLILCFMPRKIGDAIQKKTIEEFSMKADEMVESLNRRYHDPTGREVVVVERTADPGDVGGEELIAEEDYDFGPPEVETN